MIVKAKIESFKDRNVWCWVIGETLQFWFLTKIVWGIPIFLIFQWIQSRPLQIKVHVSWNDLYFPLFLGLVALIGHFKKHQNYPEGIHDASVDLSAPKSAEFLLWLFLPREGREAAIGDTNETFEQLVDDFGPRRAKLWYWGEVARSVWPLLTYLGERIWKGSLVGCGLEWLRRQI